MGSPDAGRTCPGQSAGEVRVRRADAAPYSSPRMKTTFKPTSFAVRISPGPHAVIEVSGELDLAGAPVLKSTVHDLELSAVHDAVLDLRQLVFIDVAGIRALLDLYAEFLSGATALIIIPGPRSVQRVFELTRLDRLLPFSGP